MVRDAFGMPPRIHEYQRGAVRQNQLRQAIVDLRPHLIAGHGSKLIFRNLDSKIQFASMTAVNDVNLFAGRDKSCDLFDWPHCGRQADPLEPRATGLNS